MMNNPVTARMRSRVEVRRHRYDVRPAPNPVALAMAKSLLELWASHPTGWHEALIAKNDEMLTARWGNTIRIPHITR